MPELVVERREGGVIVLKLNRPAARNALNMQLREQLAEAFIALSADTSARAVVLTGGDSIFAAGADLKEVADKGAIEIVLRGIERLWKPIAECPLPIIAAVCGSALGGGCELAMHADIIVAGESAQFGQPEIRVGIMPGAGGTQRLLRSVGKYKAMLILLTGQPISAHEAERAGLATMVVADDTVLQTALDLAATISQMPQIAVSQIKEVVQLGADAPLATALALERKAFQLLFDTKDQKEGMRAFIEKRRASFSGEGRP